MNPFTPFHSGACALALALTTSAGQVEVPLPWGGVAPGRETVVPLVIPAHEALAGVQMDIAFDATRMAVDGVQVQGPADGLVVDGGPQPGREDVFRLLVYSRGGPRITNAVSCNLVIRGLAHAKDGRSPLQAAPSSIAGDVMGEPLKPIVRRGEVLVGDAFGNFPDGGRIQFRAADGQRLVILSSQDLTTWDPVAVVTGTNGLVTAWDPGVPNAPPHRSYRVVEAPGR